LLLLYLILVQFSVSTITAVNAQPEDDAQLEEILSDIIDLLRNLNRTLSKHSDDLDELKKDLEDLQKEVDNIHSSYLTQVVFEAEMNNLNVRIDSLDKRISQSNQISNNSFVVSITTLVFFAGAILAALLRKP